MSDKVAKAAIALGYCTEEQLAEATRAPNPKKLPPLEVMVKMGYMTNKQVIDALYTSMTVGDLLK